MQFAYGTQPNISYLRTFGCVVYIPIAPPQRTKMGPQSCLGIYIGFDSTSNLRYLESQMGDTVKACPKDYEFDESIFPALGNELL